MQLFTVLEKYHQVPDNLEDLKAQFNLLREATSRNVENLQQVINLQQMYTTALCGHINIIFSRLTKLETDIQALAEKIKTEQDDVQLDAPDFDPHVDGPDTQRAYNTTAVVSVHELLTSPDPEPIHASNTQEETADREQHDTSHPIPEDCLTISPNKFQTLHLQILSPDYNKEQQQNTTPLMKSRN